MSKILFMFPGQGSQAIGMGKDIYEKEATVRDLFQKAKEYCDKDFTKLCFEGTEEELKNTENAQPCIFLCSYALASVVRNKAVSPICLMGHSLGEYTAVAMSGMLNFKDAIKLISIRGKLMAKAGEKNPGTMAAIIGLNASDVDAICKEAGTEGTVVPANYNSPEQLVISGSIKGIQKAMETAKAKGAKRAIQLQVSGAFHSPLMSDVANEFLEELKKIKFLDANIPVISNVTAEPVYKGDEMRDLLYRQLTSPVKWVSCVEKAVQLGATQAVEIGPGKVLSGLIKRINQNLNTVSIEDSIGVNSFQIL